MADELVFTGLSSTPGAPTVTLQHGINGITDFATGTFNGIAFIGYGVRRPDRFSLIEYAGTFGSDAKFFGKSHIVYLIKGAIVSRGGTRTSRYTNLETHTATLLGLNAGRFGYTLSGPITRSSVIVQEIILDPIGVNTGPFLFFTINAVGLLG